MHVRELTRSTFDDAVRSGIVLVDFWAPWCGPCRAFAPVFERVAQAHPDVSFVKVNTENEPELATALRIQALPTLMVFKEGVLVFAQPGMLSAAALDELVGQARALDMSAVRRAQRAKKVG